MTKAGTGGGGGGGGCCSGGTCSSKKKRVEENLLHDSTSSLSPDHDHHHHHHHGHSHNHHSHDQDSSDPSDDKAEVKKSSSGGKGKGKGCCSGSGGGCSSSSKNKTKKEEEIHVDKDKDMNMNMDKIHKEDSNPISKPKSKSSCCSGSGGCSSSSSKNKKEEDKVLQLQEASTCTSNTKSKSSCCSGSGGCSSSSKNKKKGGDKDKMHVDVKEASISMPMSTSTSTTKAKSSCCSGSGKCSSSSKNKNKKKEEEDVGMDKKANVNVKESPMPVSTTKAKSSCCSGSGGCSSSSKNKKKKDVDMDKKANVNVNVKESPMPASTTKAKSSCCSGSGGCSSSSKNKKKKEEDVDMDKKANVNVKESPMPASTTKAKSSCCSGSGGCSSSSKSKTKEAEEKKSSREAGAEASANANADAKQLLELAQQKALVQRLEQELDRERNDRIRADGELSRLRAEMDEILSFSLPFTTRSRSNSITSSTSLPFIIEEGGGGGEKDRNMVEPEPYKKRSRTLSNASNLSFSDQLFQSLSGEHDRSSFGVVGGGDDDDDDDEIAPCCKPGGICDQSQSQSQSQEKKPSKLVIEHGKPDCVAIVREDGLVDVYDVKGQVKTFTAAMDIKHNNGPSRSSIVNSNLSELCFSSHGHDNVDGFLTPCFDHEGCHGDPEEGCFCGVAGPHLHAHVHSEEICVEALDGVGLTQLANITLYPVELMSVPEKVEDSKKKKKMTTMKEKNEVDEHGSGGGCGSGCSSGCGKAQASSDGGEEKYHMPSSIQLPTTCNSRELTRSLAEHGDDAAKKYDASKQRIAKIQHDDHFDTLVRNEKTGQITLEHDCKDCGDTDVHGALDFVSKRSFSTAAEYRKIQMNFYQVPKNPLRMLDVLADFFAMETDKSHIIRNAFHHSPSRVQRKPCCKAGVCSNLNEKTGSTHSSATSTTSEEKRPRNVRSTIHVKGLCCAAEIPMVNSIIQPLRGVSDVSVNPTTKLVHLSHNPDVTTAEEVVNALNREKFGATLKKDGGAETKATRTASMGPTSGRSSFFVSGICCSSEIPAINSILEPLAGVLKVTINVPNKTVYVEHEFASISAKDIKNALDKEKFEARIETDAGATRALRSTVMSKYVESTFRVDSFIGQEDSTKIKTLLREQYSKDHLSHTEVHIPSKTIKVDHNPNLVSTDTLIAFLKDSGFELALIADGLKEGIWTSGEDEDDIEEEHSKLQWHIILSGVFWIVSMLHFIGGHWDYLKYTGIISVALGIPKIAQKAMMTLRRRQFDTNCMMLFATIGAVALQEYSEAAAVTFLFSISDWLETLSTTRARNALSAIVRLRPERAKVKDPVSGRFVFAPASSVAVGSIVSVRTGDKIPCDGVIVEGSSVVDESSLTGESRPVQKGPGSIVSGGTVNAGIAQLLVETTSTSDNSAVARLIRLVEDAQANRSPTEKMIDAFAKRYTPVVVLLAISMCTFPWIVGKETGREWTKIGLVTIVIACPCALIISTPVTYVAGLAAAAQRGIVVKGGAHLETLGRVKKIAFDKTGTLTEGNFKLLHLRTWGAKSRAEALQFLYCIEADASHPLAAAIISAAKAEQISVPLSWTIENHQNLEGEGVTASINGQTVYVGNYRLFERLTYINNLPDGELQLTKRWMDDGGTVGFLSVEGYGIVASYCVADAVRKEARHVIASFNKLGIDTNMLTGDNAKAANSIGQGLGLTERQIKSQLLPNEKLDLVRELIEEEKSASAEKSCFQTKRPGLVLMCGDGVNDAPALAIADVGVAMGAGAALAMETADVTLLDSNLLKLLKVVKLGRRVSRTIIENVVFSFVAKAVVMGFTFAGYSSLWAAIGSDVGAMLIVTANGMKLLPSKKSVRAGTGFDSFEVSGATKAAGGNDETVSFPIHAKAGEEAIPFTDDDAGFESFEVSRATKAADGNDENISFPIYAKAKEEEIPFVDDLSEV